MIRQREQYGIDVGTSENFPEIIIRLHTIVVGLLEPLGVYLIAPFPGMGETFTAYIANSHDLHVFPGDISTGDIRPCTAKEMSGTLAPQADESHVHTFARSCAAFTSGTKGRRCNHIGNSDSGNRRSQESSPRHFFTMHLHALSKNIVNFGSLIADFEIENRKSSIDLAG
jgi:hypothetical protein